ncbi:sigma-70 family RNA polymerase sigma factor [Hyphomicrobium sp. LHD-15]|uniref:RNA polymerase sigma factor n=1 Tax=Hyphomicrobium sp. LHD-15 TaxID=3072142 RepID=UPI00280EBC5B|nr:sigma-70 family RNA polymerase sigma factor [Hyphomicrobium sp. LHD-15]MDQ8697364.1 sigma-70 family RNA polymerase sigma factor [Hyphomicrobium sp. LHD-15]
MTKPLDLAALYVSEGARLRLSVTRLIGDPAAAADLVHDVFLRLWRRHKTLEGCDAAYLARSARNAAIDHIRAQRARAAYIAGTVPEQHAGVFPSPHEIVEARDGLRQVDDVIRGLPERTRHIFLLNRVHGRTYCEIAEALGITASGVEKHMARALKALRSAIEES